MRIGDTDNEKGNRILIVLNGIKEEQQQPRTTKVHNEKECFAEIKTENWNNKQILLLLMKCKQNRRTFNLICFWWLFLFYTPRLKCV